MNLSSSMKNLSFRSFVATCAVIFFVSVTACKDKAEKNSQVSGTDGSTVATSGENSSAPQTATTQIQTSELTNTLLPLAPDNAFAFIIWDRSTPASQRYSNSPWGQAAGMGLDSLSVVDSSSLSLPALAELLKKSGINLEDNKTTSQVAHKGVIFVAPPATLSVPPAQASGDKPATEITEPEPEMAIIVESEPGYNLAQSLEKFKAETEKAGYKVTANESDGVKSISIAANPAAASTATSGTANPAIPGASDPMAGVTDPANDPLAGGLAAQNKAPEIKKPLIIAWKDNRASVSTNEQIAKSVLVSQKASVPPVASTDHFKAATAGFPAAEQRIVLGYVDVEQLLTLSSPASPVSLPPVQAAAFAQSMDDSPRNNARILFRKDASESNPWIKALNVSQSNSVLSIAPEQSMTYLSLDGKTIKQIKDLLLAELVPAGPELDSYKQQLAVLDNIARYGIATQVAPVGQSFLPMPDISLAFESTDSATTLAKLKNLIDFGIQNGTGMPAPWTEKEVGGVKASVSQTSLGIAVFLVSKNNLVLVTSSEKQLQNTLAAIDSGKFALTQKASEPVSAALSNGQNMGTVYVNFSEIGKFMEDMGSLLSMFIPNAGNTPSTFTDPAKIAYFKKLGVMVGTASSNKVGIDIVSFYRPLEQTATQTAANSQ